MQKVAGIPVLLYPRRCFFFGTCTDGRKYADRTEHGNDVIFLVFLATVFGNLEVWKVKKLYIFLEYITAGV